MSKSDDNTPFIRGSIPKNEHEIVLTVSNECFVEGRKFKDRYLSDHPMRDEYTETELNLLGAAFLRVAGALPIFSYDLIRWTTETCMFDGRSAVREYAERVIGMEYVETNVDRGPGRKWSPMTASPSDTAKLSYASYSDLDALKVAEEIVQLVNAQGRRGDGLLPMAA
ncbi:hypothetical protein [Sphingopyxis sp. RIFCSPHIGHO2_12_FULL_65_19]|uniref:hypothetical protein n=1 Tax=Sphingopyxis sp. RIFCSPHIGHO2_12_FULL_65_19 TaxID=1802172 RepID=UPI0008D6BD0B|nr:hypothetical protein [Sphingopyxis sp. RIFCSPHIGHO2_12_FULL_65_19]OHD07576.1 MAG: hypothetical protein A3E77_09345 [Sphingopyxis sp. RIFCSPHIGHO2_12_FULL_65_19]